MKRSDPVAGGLNSGMSSESCLYMFLREPGSFVGGNTENDNPEYMHDTVVSVLKQVSRDRFTMRLASIVIWILHEKEII